ncbi:MAG: hypothetical protein AAB338_02720 [Patescibacteria group bacterium]
MKKYRAMFLAGDANVGSKDFYTPEDFKEATIILELMDRREVLEEEYGCHVSLRVYPVEEFPPVVKEIESSRHWWNLAVRRISSFFSL